MFWTGIYILSTFLLPGLYKMSMWLFNWWKGVEATAKEEIEVKKTEVKAATESKCPITRLCKFFGIEPPKAKSKDVLTTKTEPNATEVKEVIAANWGKVSFEELLILESKARAKLYGIIFSSFDFKSVTTVRAFQHDDQLWNPTRHNS